MPLQPVPPSEPERLAALERYALLDTPAEQAFDRITALAAKLFGTPIAWISLVDANRVWHKSNYGIDTAKSPRDGAFCAYTILGSDPFIVPDAAADLRFAHSPLVTGPTHIRFYAGAPLVTPEGLNLGSLCVADTAPRALSEAEATSLTHLAGLVIMAVEARLTTWRLRMLESSVEHATDVIVITEAGPIDEPGPRILYVNHAFTQMTGYSAAEVLGKTPRMFQGPNTSADTRREIRQALEQWQPVHAELLNYRKDGSEFWVELSIVPVALEERCWSHWVSIQRDTTERRKAHRALEEARDEAERANNAKSEFLSRMSHELRTPLNAILGFGQLLEMSNPTPPQQKSIAHVLHGGRHLLDLINEVLDIARIEAGRLELVPEPVQVATVLQEVLALVRPLATARNVSLGISDAERLLTSPAVQADRQRLKQVLLNLVSNAIKYNSAAGRVDLTCEQKSEERQLRLSVRDTGLGIASEDLPKLFAPFERLKAAHSEVEGTGMGLAISKRLIEAMGGAITVDSVVGRGSVFSLELPLSADASQETGEKNFQAFVVPADLQAQPATHTVLYVEDNFSNLTLVQAIFALRSGVELLSAMQGRSGLRLARERRPDLILLDLHLPDMPGDALLQTLKADESTREIPVIMVSADATPAQVQRLLALGAKAYLTKPLEIPTLLQVVNGALAEKR